MKLRPAIANPPKPTRGTGFWNCSQPLQATPSVSSAFDAHEASPYSNLKDQEGNEYLCQINLMDGKLKPTSEACTPLDEWTSKLT